MIQFQVKVLEQQLEQEHEERINFLRERHELEGKIMGLQVNKMFKPSPEISQTVRQIKSNLFHFQDLLDRSGDEEQVAKLKKDLIMIMILMMMMMMMMMVVMMIRQ